MWLAHFREPAENYQESSEWEEGAGHETHVVDEGFPPLLLPSHRGLCSSLTWPLTPTQQPEWAPEHGSDQVALLQVLQRLRHSLQASVLTVACRQSGRAIFFLIVFHVALTHVVFGVPHADWVWISDQDIFESERGAYKITKIIPFFCYYLLTNSVFYYFREPIKWFIQKLFKN